SRLRERFPRLAESRKRGPGGPRSPDSDSRSPQPRSNRKHAHVPNSKGRIEAQGRRARQVRGAMPPAASYRPWSTKRPRRAKAEVDAIRNAILSVLSADHPQTVRQVFYQLVVRGVIEKTEAEYKTTVIRLLTEMRLSDRPTIARIALTPEQIRHYRLPTRPTK